MAFVGLRRYGPIPLLVKRESLSAASAVFLDVGRPGRQRRFFGSLGPTRSDNPRPLSAGTQTGTLPAPRTQDPRELSDRNTGATPDHPYQYPSKTFRRALYYVRRDGLLVRYLIET
jgi:hypothetical protein